MSLMNCKRMAISGLVASVIIFVLNGIINGAILSGDFMSWSNQMGQLIHPQSQGVSMLLWTLMCLIYGYMGMWIYAGQRAHSGKGAKTALMCGFAVFVLAKLAPALDFYAIGILPSQMLIEQVIAGFITIVSGIFVGAWMYKD